MEIPEERYLKLPLEKLIVYAILEVRRKKEECTFERLVKESFTLFPKCFSLYRYKNWPDSLKLDRPLRDLRKHGYIIGNPRHKFNLTKLGERYSLNVQKELFGGSLIVGKPSVQVGRKEKRLLDSIKLNPEFKAFGFKKDNLKIDNVQIRRLSFSTMETSIKAVNSNLDLLIKLCKEAKENDLLLFLTFCKGKFNE